MASDDAINAAAADLGDDDADAAADASAEAPGYEGGTLPDSMEAPEGAPDGMTPPDGVNGVGGEAPELPEGAKSPDATGGTPPSGAPQRDGEGANEREDVYKRQSSTCASSNRSPTRPCICCASC